MSKVSAAEKRVPDFIEQARVTDKVLREYGLKDRRLKGCRIRFKKPGKRLLMASKAMEKTLEAHLTAFGAFWTAKDAKEDAKEIEKLDGAVTKAKKAFDTAFVALYRIALELESTAVPSTKQKDHRSKNKVRKSVKV